MSGRVTSLAVDPTDRDIIYAGAASGALAQHIQWDGSGAPLRRRGHFEHCSAWRHPTRRDLGRPGEGNPRNSHTSGRGIYRSIDGGSTWSMMGLEETRTIHRIRILRPIRNCYVAAMGSAGHESGARVHPGWGRDVDHVLSVDDTTGCRDDLGPQQSRQAVRRHVVLPPRAVVLHFGRRRRRLHVTHDGGDNWDQLGEDRLPGGERRMGLA